MPSPEPVSADCFADRYLLTDLARRIAQSSGLEDLEVEKILEDKVNTPKEKLSFEHKTFFAPVVGSKSDKDIKEKTISAFEAYAFMKRLIADGQFEGKAPQSVVARSMDELFFNGQITKGAPSSVPVKITNYHDSDTPTVKLGPLESCRVRTTSGSVRITGTDGPEVGGYSEGKAEWARYNAAGGSEGMYGAYVLDERFEASYVNPKMVRSVDSVHAYLAEGKWNPKKLGYKERMAMNWIIAATIDYTGNLATLPMNDLNSWGLTGLEIGAAMLFGSEIRWTSSDTPAALCGTWQPYDDYGRIIGGIEELTPDRLKRYLKQRLSQLMSVEGEKLYKAYLQKVSGDLKKLEAVGNKALYETAKAIVDGVLPPSKMYSEGNCEKMALAYERLLADMPEYLAKDRQLFQIIVGNDYSYAKYRNQRSDAYEKAAESAMREQFGLWTETTFNALYKSHEDDPRYHPSDCKLK